MISVKKLNKGLIGRYKFSKTKRKWTCIYCKKMIGIKIIIVCWKGMKICINCIDKKFKDDIDFYKSKMDGIKEINKKIAKNKSKIEEHNLVEQI